MRPTPARAAGRRWRAALAAGCAAVVLALTGCAPDASTTATGGEDAAEQAVGGGDKIDVDTPALERLKAAAGIADCPTATGDGAVDGGLPDLTLPCLGGGADVDLADLRGPLVLNAWYSSCAPCRKELPVLAEFDAEHGDEVTMLGVDYADPQTTAALQLLRDSGVTYPSVADTDGAIVTDETMRIVGFPTTVLVAADGTVAYVHAGEITSVAQLEKLVEQYLGVDL
ncbi:TlpA disulfide reductase family protein [Nocardioides sp. GY 10127]|uniref:TlpA family protein disulfide reductase n=1 Tax=Nocardioides sp. GY 10127 TaxID=2569762 RepID=UPI0010A81EAA|nr:TlpA disulfide reductase family protein [Nocardioides sp. GY 10127]TIC83321.1 TlpA family protein disulfide reductase [Nocardioides sp. GY 10127]